jgi:hypothetical protein
MTRFKELARIRAAIKLRNEPELRWAVEYCQMRLKTATRKDQAEYWRGIQREISETLRSHSPTASAPLNFFSLGAQTGGQTSSEAREQEQSLRDLFNAWTGDYSSDIREFAFLLRVDGHIHRYTAMWNIYGAQKAKRKRDWIEVEIGVPETWWRLAHTDQYKKRLAEEIEKGFNSMIEVLRKNRRDIRAETLLRDWFQVKAKFLEPKVKVQ